MRVVTALFPEEIADSLNRLAAREGRSKARLIREAVIDYLAKQQELDRLTVEGLEAMRADDVVEHEEIAAELDRWGS